MMERIAANGVRTIIVETANRFARDLIVQETGRPRGKLDVGVLQKTGCDPICSLS